MNKLLITIAAIFVLSISEVRADDCISSATNYADLLCQLINPNPNTALELYAEVLAINLQSCR